MESNSALASGSVLEQGKTVPAGEVGNDKVCSFDVVLGWKPRQVCEKGW